MSVERCPFLAQHRRFWPGKEPDHVCLIHAAKSLGVARAMGFLLVLEPIDPSEWDPAITCNHAAERPKETP